MSREKELDFFIALRRREDFLTLFPYLMGAGTGWKRQIREEASGKGIPQGAPISHGEHLSARSRAMDRKKDTGKENEIGLV